MTPIGWIIMLLAVGGMTAFLVWCVWKVLSTPEATSHLHGQPDLESPDQKEG